MMKGWNTNLESDSKRGELVSVHRGGGGQGGEGVCKHGVSGLIHHCKYGACLIMCLGVILETVSSFMEIVETFEYALQILFTIECSMQV